MELMDETVREVGAELLAGTAELRYASICDLDFQISDLTYTLSPKTINW